MGFFLVSLNSHTSCRKWEHPLPLQRGALLKDAPWSRHLFGFPLNLVPANCISPRSQLIYEKSSEQPPVFSLLLRSLCFQESDLPPPARMVPMTWNKMTSHPLSWMAWDIVFFSIPDQNKEKKKKILFCPICWLTAVHK